MAKARERSSQGKNPERETALLEAYLDVAMREGVENVTLQKVASQATVAYSTVHYYFGSGELTPLDRALAYVATASEAFMESRLQPAMAAPERNALTTYVDAKFEWGRRFPTYSSMLSYFRYQATRDAEAKKISTALFKSTLQKMQMLLLQEVGKGHYPRLEDLEALAVKILTILNGALIAASSHLVKDGALRAMTQAMIEEVIGTHAQRSAAR